MQLNEVERNALEKARRLETRWPRSRLLGLFVGVVMVASGLVPDHFLQTLMLVLLGIAQILFIAKLWHGRPELRLLLKLAEENVDYTSNQ